MSKSVVCEEEENYRSIFDSANDALFIHHIDTGKIISVNQKMCDLYGYTKEEAPDLSVEAISEGRSPYTQKDALKWILKAAHGEPQLFEWRAKDKAGNLFWVEVNLKRAAIGGKNRLLAIVRDISERKRAEKALKESERKYRLLADNVTDVIWTMNMDLQFTYMSPSVKRLRGYTPEEATQMSLEQTFTAASYHKAIQIVAAEISRDGIPGMPPDRSIILELEVNGKDGRIIPVEVSASFIRDETGSPTGIIGITRNISDRKRAEKALRESEAKFKSIFENKGTATGIFGDDHVIRECNTVFELLSGYSKAEIINKMKWSDFVVPEELERLLEYHAQRSENPDSPPSQYECRIKTRKGDIRTVIVNIHSIGKDRIVSLVDITARKQAEKEREKLQIQLTQARKMESIGTLAGGIAHNFNNILMGIQGRTSLMMVDKDSSHPDMEHLKGIESYVRSAISLTKDLLGFARGGKYQVKPTDLNALVRKETRMFSRTKKEIQVHESYSNNLWAAEVDQGQIQQALLNLYLNAWQAMPVGGALSIKTENVLLSAKDMDFYQIPAGYYVKISITDTGTGMDKETQQRIFDPFFSTKRVADANRSGSSFFPI